MKTLIPLLLFLMLSCARLAAQQPFILQVSPREQTIGDGSASFTITVSAQLGFTASVYLTAGSPTLPQSNIWLTSAVIAAPYTTSATLNVKPLSDETPSTHTIVIEGKNGPAVARDTVTVRMSGRTGWRVYTTANSPLPDNYIQGVDIDRNGLAWIKAEQGVFTFDGKSTWQRMDTLQWPGSAGGASNRIGLDGRSTIAFDSAGGAWFAVTNSRGQGLAHLYQGAWSMHAIPGPGSPHLHFGQIAADGKGNIWLPTIASTDTVMLKFDGSSWTAITLPGIQPRGQITVDGHNHIWVAGTGAVEEFDGTYWTHHDSLGPASTYGDAMQVFADRDDNVWAAGSHGVTKISGASKVFHESSTRYGEHFPGEGPSLLEFDRSGGIWVAFFDRYLGRFRNGVWQLYRDSVWNIVGSAGIEALKSGPDNSIWVGTTEGLAILAGGSATLSAPTIAPAAADARLSLPHPNPTSGDIALTVTLRSRTRARLALVDELGRTVAAPLDEMLDPGEHPVTIATDGIPTGAYFLRLSTSSGTEARPITIIH